MNWVQRYRIRHYIDHAFWLLPVLGIAAGMLLVRFTHLLDDRFGWRLELPAEAVRNVLGMLSSAMFTFVVFVCSALLVAVQLASAQLTPRVIPLVFRDRVTRWSLTLFLFSFTFCVAATLRIAEVVPALTTQFAAYSCVLCLGVFMVMVDHVGKTLRAAGMVQGIARRGHGVIESVYPHLLAPSESCTMPAPSAAEMPTGPPSGLYPAPHDGVVLAFDVEGLTQLAESQNCVIEMLPQVGDYLARGEGVFQIYQAPAGASPLDFVAIGPERTLEQDPAYVFRLIVDIASKALSPGINDPSTAVLAIDHLQHLLRSVGERRLDTGIVRDPAGRVRLIYRTPDWADYVHLAITEIRLFGGASIQVARRLHAMLEALIATLPAERTALLRRELDLLHRSNQQHFSDPDDRAMADEGDAQGVGGTVRIARVPDGNRR